ncbi:hypothetical protein GCM10027057_23020 [Marisediminicola antarctica]
MADELAVTVVGEGVGQDGVPSYENPGTLVEQRAQVKNGVPEFVSPDGGFRNGKSNTHCTTPIDAVKRIRRPEDHLIAVAGPCAPPVRESGWRSPLWRRSVLTC